MTLSHCPHYVKLPTLVLRYQVLYTVSVILFTLSKTRLYNVYIITFKSVNLNITKSIVDVTI